MSRLDLRRGSASCLSRNPHPIRKKLFSLPAWGTPILTGILLLAALFALQTTPAAAQEFRGTISGTVTDSTGAAIPGANVTVTEISSGTTSKTVSNGTGQYVIPLLLPGHYTIAVQKAGFKQAIRKGIALDASAHLIIDMQMQLGSTSQTVTVTAAAPLLNTASASIGQTITTKEVEDLPIDGRTPMMLTELSIGVLDTAQPTLVHPFDNNGAANWSIGGSPSQTSEILLDGSPDELWNYTLAYSPPQEAVQQVSVEAFDTDAAFGHTQAGVINQVLKSGGNEIHGAAYEYGQISALDANTYINDQNNTPIAVTHFNQYGVEASGPVFIPHVFNGHNKLFWLFAWEGLKDSQPSTDLATVPTAAERQGDFSALLPLGCPNGYQNGNPAICSNGKANPYQLYNPFTATQSGKTINRQPIPDNNFSNAGISIDSIAANYLKLYPQPNTTGTAYGEDNYISNAPSIDNYNNELGRLDYNLSDRTHFFFDIRHNIRSQVKENYFNNIATGESLSRENWGATLDGTHTFNASTFMDLRFNWTYFNQIEGEPSDGTSPSTLGFPSSLAQNSQHLQIPYIEFGSCGSQTSFQCLGNEAYSHVPSQSYQIFGDVIKTIGNHNLKFGIDAREYRLDSIANKYPDGYFQVGTNWVQQSSSSSAPAWAGDFASFLMGLPTKGEYDIDARSTFHTYYLGAFVQDNWRVSPTLTLNLGVRFDHDSPYYEKFGRVVNGFDTTAQNPVAAQAEAAYAANPISEIPASQFQVLGGLTFPNGHNGAYYQTDSHWFSPRLGFAWSPRWFDNRTVIRGGFGMFVSQYTIANLDANGTWSSNPILDTEGFSSATTFNPTSNNYLTPASTLDNPYPDGFSQPTGSSAGLATFDGQNVINFVDPHPTDPYSLRWNLGIQQSLNANTMFEIDYVGNHMVHMPVSTVQYNYIPAQYLSTLPTRDQNTINTLTATTSNPFYNIPQMTGTTIGKAKTVSVAQLLSRYPEYDTGETGGNQVGGGQTSQGVFEDNATIGQSFFNALDARIEHRMSHGLWLVANYSWSKLEDQNIFMNDTDPKPNKHISPFDFTNHFVFGGTYDLPIGTGKAVDIHSRWLNELAGGWVLNAVYTYQTGPPIYWQYDMVTTGKPITINNKIVSSNQSAISTDAFDLASADQFAYHLRTFPLTISSIRADGINDLDSSVLKNFPIKGPAYFQLRFETFNTLNHPEFVAPGVDPTSKFGIITKQSNLPRQIQIGGRLVF
jgi:hypothetical protein